MEDFLEEVAFRLFLEDWWDLRMQRERGGVLRRDATVGTCAA